MKQEKSQKNKNNTKTKVQMRTNPQKGQSTAAPLFICVCKRQRHTKVVSTGWGIDPDTEKEQLSVFSGGDCQCSRCCFSSL